MIGVNDMRKIIACVAIAIMLTCSFTACGEDADASHY